MADWKTARFDPAYGEPLDPEIIPLCDALNAAGFTTTQSCCGHGRDWARVWFEHSSDERIEQMARFVMSQEAGDFRPHFSMFQKEILPQGYLWCLEIHLNDVYSTTPSSKFLELTIQALDKVSNSIAVWQSEL